MMVAGICRRLSLSAVSVVVCNTPRRAIIRLEAASGHILQKNGKNVTGRHSVRVLILHGLKCQWQSTFFGMIKIFDVFTHCCAPSTAYVD